MFGNFRRIVCARDNPTSPDLPREKVTAVVAALMKSGMHSKDSSDGSPSLDQSKLRMWGQKEVMSRGFVHTSACKHSGFGYLSSISIGPPDVEK